MHKNQDRWVGHRFTAKHSRMLGIWEVVAGPDGQDPYLTVRLLYYVSGPLHGRRKAGRPLKITPGHHLFDRLYAWPLRMLPRTCHPKEKS